MGSYDNHDNSTRKRICYRTFHDGIDEMPWHWFQDIHAQNALVSGRIVRERELVSVTSNCRSQTWRLKLLADTVSHTAMNCTWVKFRIESTPEIKTSYGYIHGPVMSLNGEAAVAQHDNIMFADLSHYLFNWLPVLAHSLGLGDWHCSLLEVRALDSSSLDQPAYIPDQEQQWTKIINSCINCSA